MVRDDAGSAMSVGSTARMVMRMSAESDRVRLWGCGEREVGPERRRDSDEALAITCMNTMPMSMTISMAMVIKSIEAIEARQNRQSRAERELLTDIQRMRRPHSKPSLLTCGARWGRGLRGCVCGDMAVVWQEGA